MNLATGQVRNVLHCYEVAMVCALLVSRDYGFSASQICLPKSSEQSCGARAKAALMAGYKRSRQQGLVFIALLCSSLRMGLIHQVRKVNDLSDISRQAQHQEGHCSVY